ncbi:hypothetical protein J2S43_005964 [Catenuloplanes nepalensis]|uniref:Uncharacterized protein n=1 Tax=Catenuloplanes nepalensis TaxID=587533 RepID=A0ABT9N178_9ACTN|nr:hypothetical protein [Catenuloplanes nepalensis]MDP9797452.1 hypothetical protein [Catenuloplanes nepalensis]
MTLILAATSTNAPEMSVILFAGIAVFATAGYALACWVKPFTRCGRCDGTGTSAPRPVRDRLRGHRPVRARAPRGAADCPRCRGTGLRLRIGRRLHNHLTRLRRAAR